MEASGHAPRQRYWLAAALASALLAMLAAAGLSRAADPSRPVVLFLGDSLTAGYGLSSDQAYPARIQQRIDAAGLPYRVVNAGVSGDTSAGGLRRIGWLLRQPIDVLVLELGANDMLRGQSVEAMRANLQAIVDRVRAAYPKVRLVVAGMRAAPNLGPRYARAFDESFPQLARRNDAALVPFLLEGVIGRPDLVQPDGLHPTARGHQRVAETVWSVLGPVLREASQDEAAGRSPSTRSRPASARPRPPSPHRVPPPQSDRLSRPGP